MFATLPSTPDLVVALETSRYIVVVTNENGSTIIPSLDLDFDRTIFHPNVFIKN